MANLLAKNPDDSGVTLQILRDYLDFLIEHFPVYVSSDFCEDRVLDCVEKYPELYLRTGKGDNLVISSGELLPNLKYFNSIYSETVADYLERVTDSFVKNKLFKI